MELSIKMWVRILPHTSRILWEILVIAPRALHICFTGPCYCVMALDVSKVWDWRSQGVIPAGKCVYIQSGDPGDFDGQSARVPSLLPPLIAACTHAQGI